MPGHPTSRDPQEGQLGPCCHRCQTRVHILCVWAQHTYSWLESQGDGPRAQEASMEDKQAFILERLMPFNARSRLPGRAIPSKSPASFICVAKDISMLCGLLISWMVKCRELENQWAIKEALAGSGQEHIIYLFSQPRSFLRS